MVEIIIFAPLSGVFLWSPALRKECSLVAIGKKLGEAQLNKNHLIFSFRFGDV
jgi:hypothetical protein